jgi:hypothetical protein
MDDKTLEAAISLTAWAIKDAERGGTLEQAIENLKRIYGFLTDTDPFEEE